jgi:hypothetical protein
MSQRKGDQPKQYNPNLDPFYFETLRQLPEFNPWKPFTVELVERPQPVWLAVIERIMLKAVEHKHAGRDDDFSQVLVPMADYKALREHFEILTDEDDILVSTAIGILSVHPVNPDGATFVD